MKVYKRLFAALLSLAIMLSFTPAMAFAGGEEEDPGMWKGFKYGDYTLDAGDTYDCGIEDPRDYYSFEFVPETTGTYIFQSIGSYDTYGRILDDSGEELLTGDSGGDGDNFSISFDAEAGKTYFLQACMYYYDTVGTFTVELSKEESDPGMWKGFKYGDYILDSGDTYDCEIEDPRDYYSFEFSPDKSGSYIFKSTGSFDTVGRVLDDSGKEITEADFGGDEDNFSITFDAEAEETYYLQACMYSYEAVGTFTVELSYNDEDPGRFGGYKYGPYYIEAGDTEEVEIIDPRDYYSFEFTPSVSGKYIFKSSGNFYVCGQLLDRYEEVIDDDDDSASDSKNFVLEFDAVAGQTYYLETCMYEYEDVGTYYVSLVKKDPISIARATVSSIGPINYTGRAITPNPVVKVNGITLTRGVDYTLSYINNVKAGTAYVVITGKDDYTGTINRAFTIRPVVPALKLTSVKKGSKSFTATWPKASSAVQKQFTGYQIQYGTSKAFLSSKTKNTTQKSAKKVVIRKLKSKKTYYVRIRRYLKWNGQIIYSAWSPVKKVKTK